MCRLRHPHYGTILCKGTNFSPFCTHFAEKITKFNYSITRNYFSKSLRIFFPPHQISHLFKPFQPYTPVFHYVISPT